MTEPRPETLEREQDAITLKDAAQHFGFTVSTLRAEAGRGRLTCEKFSNAKSLIFQELRKQLRRERNGKMVGYLSISVPTEGVMPQSEFKQIHAAMKALVEKQDRDGWRSVEIEKCSKRVLLALWACANNDPVAPALVRGLAEDVEALAKARDSARQTMM